MTVGAVATGHHALMKIARQRGQRHGGESLQLESGIGEEIRKALEARGHKPRDGRGAMGGYQAILIDPRTGVLMGGSDPRKDGLAIGW